MDWRTYSKRLQSINHTERRIARDGRAYLFQEFASHYGWPKYGWYALQIWEESEIVDSAGQPGGLTTNQHCDSVQQAVVSSTSHPEEFSCGNDLPQCHKQCCMTGCTLRHIPLVLGSKCTLRHTMPHAVLNGQPMNNTTGSAAQPAEPDSSGINTK